MCVPRLAAARQVSVVLDRPQNPANIGAVVRAMANLGYSDLRLVDPAPFDRVDLLRYAHRCQNLVEALTIFPELDGALADATYVVGTAALVHPGRPHTDDVRSLAAELAQRAQAGRVVLLFGTEADGLDRGALDRCHLVASLPVAPDYPALNLAQSALLFLYEVHMAFRPEQLQAPKGDPPDPPARQADLERLFSLYGDVLTTADYFRYSPEVALRSLRNITYRAELDIRETNMLTGMLKKILGAMTKTDA